MDRLFIDPSRCRAAGTGIADEVTVRALLDGRPTGELAVTESRVEQGRAKAPAKPLLASTGFATMMLILHPFYQNSFEFSDLGYAQEGGKQWVP